MKRKVLQKLLAVVLAAAVVLNQVSVLAMDIDTQADTAVQATQEQEQGQEQLLKQEEELEEPEEPDSEEGVFDREGEHTPENTQKPQANEDTQEKQPADSQHKKANAGSPRSGSAFKATFAEQDLSAADNEVSYIVRDAEMTAQTLNVMAEFSGAGTTTDRKVEIDLKEGMLLSSALGMKRSGSTWVFDASTLPTQNQGTISNVTWEPLPVLTDYQNYQPGGGKLTYYITPSQTQVPIDITVALDMAFSANSGSRTFTDPILVKTSSHNNGVYTEINTEKLEKYTINGSVKIYNYRSAEMVSSGVGVETSVGFCKRVTAPDAGYTNTMSKNILFQEFIINYKLPKKLGFQNVTFTGEKIGTVAHTSDSAFDYITITYNNIRVKENSSISGWYYLNFIPTDEVNDGERYNIKPESMSAKDYYGEACDTATHQIPVVIGANFQNRLTVKNSTGNYVTYQPNTDNVDMFLGAYTISNSYTDTITDQKVQLLFHDSSVGVTGLRLAKGTGTDGDTLDIEIKTNLGRTITTPTLTNVSNPYDYVLVDLYQNGRQPGEYITEVNYKGVEFEKGYGSEGRQYNASILNQPTMFFGHFFENPADNEVNFTVKTAPQDDTGFSGPNAEVLNGVMQVYEADSVHFTTSVNYTNSSGFLAGNSYSMKFNASLYNQFSLGRCATYFKGAEYYIREGDYLQVDPSTFKITNSGNVYQVSDGSLSYTETLDNQGKKVYKIVLEEAEHSASIQGMQLKRSELEFDYKIKSTTPTTAIKSSEIIYIKPISGSLQMNPNGNADYYHDENRYDVDGSGDLTKKLGTINKDIQLNVRAQQDFNVNTAANLDGGNWVTYDYGTNREVINLNPEGTARYQLTVSNNAGVAVPAGYTALVPIPKAGEHTDLMPGVPTDFDPSTHLQKEAFTWTVSLSEALNLGSEYQVLYCDTYETDKDSASFKPYSNFAADPSQIRMVKISKNSNIPDGYSESIDFKLELDAATADAYAGNTNIYSARIYREIPGSSAGYKPSEPVAIRLKTGVVKGVVFNDNNRNGTQDAGETGRNGVTVTAYESGTTNVVESTATSNIDSVDGSYRFMGLEKTQDVDIVFANPTVDDSLRFSTGTISGDNRTTTVSAITPSSATSNDVKAGLITPYTVTLNPLMGTTGTAAIKRYAGEEIVTQPVAQKAAHQFDGWYEEQTLTNKVTFPYTVNGDVELYAKYIPNQHDVFFIQDGAQVGILTGVNYGTTISVPGTITEAKTGYTFAGWFTGETGGTQWDFAQDSMPDEDLTLYAQYTANQYTAKFVKDGVEVGSVVADYDTTFVVPNSIDTTKAGYTFADWFTGETGGTQWDFDTDKMPLNGVTLYARYTANQYTAKFVKDGVEVGSVVADYDTTFVVPNSIDTTKAGYTFAGWFTGETGGTQWDFDTDKMPLNGVTLYARYTADNQTISFDITGGLSHTKPDDITAPTDSNVDIDAVVAPERDGYRFLGWAAEDESPVNGTIQMPAGGLKLYAVWEDLVEAGVWKFEADDITMRLSEFQSLVNEGTLEEEILTRSNAKAYNSETGETLTPLSVEMLSQVENMGVGDHILNLVYVKKTDEDFLGRMSAPTFEKSITLTITSNPSEGSGTNGTNNSHASDNRGILTGDSTKLTLFVLFMFISCGIFVGIATKKKKHRAEEK